MEGAIPVSSVSGFIVVGIVVVYTVKVIYHHIRGDYPAPTSSQLLLNDPTTGPLSTPRLKRSDIEALLHDVPRWLCSVCAFHNIDTRWSCSLCHTARDTYLIQNTVTTTTDPSLAQESDPKSMMLLDHGARSAMNTLFYLRSLLPEDLNPRQKSARMRRQWTRSMSATHNGKVGWTRHFVNAPASATFPVHIIQVTTSNGGAAATAMWQPLDEACSSNTNVSPTLWPPLLQLSDESFSVKYAWFLSQLADLVVPFNELHLTRQSHRGDDFLNDVMHTLLALEGSELCAIVRVEFQDEIGRDAGGLQREWYLLAAEAIMTSGLFVLVNRDDQSYFINPHAATSPLPQVEAFEAVGRFIGRALLDGQGLSLPLNPVLFKAILGTPLTLDDVEMLDTQVFQSLRYVLEHDSVESLALTFAVTEDIGSGKLNVVELVEGGVDVEVTDANKHDYVQRMVHHLLFHRVERPLAALIQGVYAIIPRELLAPFDHKELELILCGLPDIDVDDWKMHTNTTDAVRTSPLWTWFWEIVADLSLEDRAKFLQYTTGSPRVPVQGFSGLTSYDGRICHFSIRGVTYTQGKYPVVHTCFNRIDLPAYPSKAALEEAIAMLLLTDATGFTLN